MPPGSGRMGMCAGRCATTDEHVMQSTPAKAGDKRRLSTSLAQARVPRGAAFECVCVCVCRTRQPANRAESEVRELAELVAPCEPTGALVAKARYRLQVLRITRHGKNPSPFSHCGCV